MIAILPIVIVFIAFGLYTFYRRWRARSLRDKPFPSPWLSTLTRSLPVYAMLAQEEQLRLQQLIQQFIAGKRFYGCGGLVITDEMRVTIAAEACLLLINKGGSVYPKLSAVLVYPTAFRVERDQHQPDGTVALGGHNLLGESWSNGKVILSWDDVEQGIGDFTDGHNVVLHEFAHQLDAESGSSNGAPPLRRNSYKSWASVFAESFEDLSLRSLHGHHTVIDEYGATNPAEFFAVATETFFEKPRELFEKYPGLYAELQTYYQLDPRQWHQ
jgi:Mlc titration factor MtfA (ptsG expression regulator)